MEVSFLNDSVDWDYQYAVVFATYHNRMVFCRHKARATFECPGGHREAGESVLEAAKRELYEETGAVRYEIEEIGPYSVEDGKEKSYGMLYYAEIFELGALPESEIEEIKLFEKLPEVWTYPEIQPVLLKKIMETKVWDRK